MSAVPRGRFVDDVFLAKAWENHPLPIGAGQTISQPLVVAAMTAALGVGPGDVVLDVGTGSRLPSGGAGRTGLSNCGDRVGPRAGSARVGGVDGRGSGRGWWSGRTTRPTGCAPFDAILVAAASETVPPLLVDQLRRPPVRKSDTHSSGDSSRTTRVPGREVRWSSGPAERGRQRLVDHARTSTGSSEEGTVRRALAHSPVPTTAGGAGQVGA